MLDVSIRPLVEEDAKISWKWRNDPVIWQYTGSRPDKTITEEIEVDWIRKILRDPTSKRFAIIVNKNTYVGNVQLTEIDDRTAQFHIFIGDRDYWGKGIAYNAIILLLDYAYSVLDLEYIWLSVNCRNERAISLYKKIGFEYSCRHNSEYITMIHKPSSNS